MKGNSPQSTSSVKLSTLLHDIVDVVGQDDREITGISLDSRNACQGDLFFACAGQLGHGITYLDDVVQTGVAAIAWEPTNDSSWSQKLTRGLETKQKVPMYSVEDLGSLIGIIADRFYGHPSKDLKVIGITGTNGKTSCSHFLARSLDSSANNDAGTEKARCGVIGTLGYGLYGDLHEASHTTPDAIHVHSLLSEMRHQGARYVVLEVSSHALDQGRVNGVSFDTAVFTNLSRDHLDYHDSMSSYAIAKKRLFELPGLKTAVVNSDDIVGRELLTGLLEEVTAVAYGFSSQSGMNKCEHVTGSNLKLDRSGLSFSVTTPWGKGQISSPLLGRFNASNVLAVLSVLLKMGFSFEQVRAQMQSLITVPGRMERIGGQKGRPLVVVDYAHTPDALEHVLMALRAHSGGILWCVFGCGGDRDKGKRPLMGAAAERYADQVVLTDDNPRTESPGHIIQDILSGIEDNSRVSIEQDRAKAIAHAIQNAQESDVVLIAGKGHEKYQLIGSQKIPFSDGDEVRQQLREEIS